MTPYRSRTPRSGPIACTLVGPLPWLPTVVAGILLVAALGMFLNRGEVIECERQGIGGECRAGGRTYALTSLVGLRLEPYTGPTHPTFVDGREVEPIPMSRLVLETTSGTVPLERGFEGSVADGRPALVRRFDTFLHGNAPRFPEHAHVRKVLVGSALVALVGLALLGLAFQRRDVTRFEVDPAGPTLVVSGGTSAAREPVQRYALTPASRFDTQRERVDEWIVLVLPDGLKVPLARLPRGIGARSAWMRRVDALLASQGTLPPTAS